MLLALLALLLLPAASPRPAAAIRDLWVRSISYSRSQSDTTRLDISIEVARQGTGSIAGALLAIKRNGSQVWTFTIPDPIVGPFTHTMTVSGGDTFEAVVDPANLFPELNEINNGLTWSFPSDWSLQALHEPFPATITISHPAELTLQATGVVEQKRTGSFPSALLLVPPFNWWQAEHDGFMETELQQATTYYSEDERSAGVSAALAIEAGFAMEGFGASVGMELEADMSAAFGRVITQTYSESFAAAVSNTYIPSGDHVVVLAQTRYDVMKYRVTTPGSYYGKGLWIGVPQRSDVDPNPELTAEVLGAYPELKDAQAVDLDGQHDIGRMKTYGCGGTGIENQTWHLDTVSNCNINVLAEKRQTVGTSAVDWTVSIEQGTYHTTAQNFRCNLFAESEFAGSSVRASFGSSQGRSHKVYQGKSHAFHYHIAPVILSKNRYKLGGWAANYTFTHGTRQRHDGLLVLCYYVHEPPANNTSPVREIMIGGDWDDWRDNWDVAIPGWPGQQQLGDPILDGLALDINSPVANLASDFYLAYLELLDAEIVWATALDPPPPELGTFLDLAVASRGRLEQILLTDPDNPAWIPDVLGLLENVQNEAGWTFNARPCRIEPEIPQEGGTVQLFYNPLRGALPAGAPVVFARLGFNGWQGGSTDHPMALDEQSGMWESGPLPVPPGAEVVNYVFADDSGHVDDRGGVEWHAETAGTVRTHHSDTVDVSLTAQGTLGFTDGTHAEGSGFRYPAGGANLLYLGGLWVGNAEFVANRDYEAEPDPEWMAGASPADGIVRDACLGAHFTSATFSDSGAASPRGLRVEQRAITQPNAPDDDFVIVSYGVHNDGQQGLDDLWIGQFADFDLDEASMLENWGGTDAALALAYMDKDEGMPYVGLCLLDRRATANLTLIHNPTYVHPLGYIPDAEKALFLQAADPAHSVPEATEASDWSVLVSAGPFNLPAGGDVNVTFAIVAGDDRDDLRANAARAGAWLLPGSEPTGVGDAGALGAPLLPILRQNAPNPFNPSTRIAFDVPRRGQVLLRIYDVNGRVVRTLVDGVMEPGSSTMTWDGRDLAGRPVSSGVYLYRLQSAQGSVSRKMTLVR